MAMVTGTRYRNSKISDPRGELLPASHLDTVGEFARSLISGAALQVGGTWNQWFTVVHRNSPTVSNLREGMLYPISTMALLSGLGYWLSTLVMTPDHYRYTPWFAWALFGKRRA